MIPTIPVWTGRQAVSYPLINVMQQLALAQCLTGPRSIKMPSSVLVLLYDCKTEESVLSAFRHLAQLYYFIYAASLQFLDKHV